MAEYRSNVYGLLAAVYRREVTSDLLSEVRGPEFLGALSDLGLELADGFIGAPECELLEALAVEYAMLFLGPGKHISPHESVHLNRDDGQSEHLWGESTVEVKKFIESSGLHYAPGYTGLPDHISVEFEFMQRSALQEGQAWGENDRQVALRCLENEKRFIREHLASWVPDFCEKVIEAAELPFYREMAMLTKEFIEFESKTVETAGTKQKGR